ncbi:MAG: hypothetical protein ABEI96_04080 [Haloarculaceae archaeon]
MAGRPPDVSDFEVLRAVRTALDESGTPVVTTQEVADRLPIKHEGVGKRLNDLAGRNLLFRKEVGVSYAWWLPEAVATVVPTAAGNRVDAGTGTESERAVEATLRDLFDVGRERFDLELGAVARVDPAADRFEIEYTSGDHEHFTPGTELPLSETYCTEPTRDSPACVADPSDRGFDDRTVYADYGLRTYLGTLVKVDDGHDRTFFFVSTEPRAEPFTDAECALQELLGERLEHELAGERNGEGVA